MDNHNVRWPTVEFSQDIINRFWSHVEKTDSCWIWTGSTLNGGHGNFRLSTKVLWLSHRLSWFLVHGVIPHGLLVCHNCPGQDNPACVNPDHLWLGTYSDNLQDAYRKGQNKGRPREEMPNTKLTEAKVLAIREQYKTENISQSEIAIQYGVSLQCISAVIRRVSWDHI